MVSCVGTNRISRPSCPVARHLHMSASGIASCPSTLHRGTWKSGLLLSVSGFHDMGEDGMASDRPCRACRVIIARAGRLCGHAVVRGCTADHERRRKNLASLAYFLLLAEPPIPLVRCVLRKASDRPSAGQISRLSPITLYTAVDQRQDQSWIAGVKAVFSVLDKLL